MRIRSLALCALVLLAQSAVTPAAEPEHLLADFGRDFVIIDTGELGCRVFDVYVANTPRQRAQGLMFVRRMADSEGMLFVYRDAQPVSMWMRNTFIPLDMIFVAADGRIVHTHAGAQPHDENVIESGVPVLRVIELNAGALERHAIDPGDRVVWPVD